MKTIYIVCEGEVTEVSYFEHVKKLYDSELQRKGLNLQIAFVGDHKLKKIQNEAKKLKKNQRNSICFACFDIDSTQNKPQELNTIISLLKKEVGCNIFKHYMVSNKQFEVWLQWHFSDAIPWTNSGNPNPDKPTKEQKKDLTNQIKDITKNHIKSAIGRAKSNNVDYNTNQPFSTCHLIENFF